MNEVKMIACPCGGMAEYSSIKPPFRVSCKKCHRSTMWIVDMGRSTKKIAAQMWNDVAGGHKTYAAQNDEAIASSLKRAGSVDGARKARLNQGLKTLAEWAARRSEGDHDESTTLTILERKVKELRSATNRAGQISAEEAAKQIVKQYGSRLAVLAD